MIHVRRMDLLDFTIPVAHHVALVRMPALVVLQPLQCRTMLALQGGVCLLSRVKLQLQLLLSDRVGTTLLLHDGTKRVHLPLEGVVGPSNRFEVIPRLPQ